MKRKIILAAAVAAAVILAAAVKISAQKQEMFVVDGENFSAEVTGSEMILSLPGNATTGYSWVITECPDLFSGDSGTYVPNPSKGLVGTGGVTRFHIQALQEGSGTMLLEYRQNWEGGNSGGTYALTLHISRRHSSRLQIDSVSFIEQ